MKDLSILEEELLGSDLRDRNITLFMTFLIKRREKDKKFRNLAANAPLLYSLRGISNS
jgi:hypothetical protein